MKGAITAVIVAALIAGGTAACRSDSAGPCKQYDSWYRTHQGHGSYEEQLHGLTLLQECKDSGGDPLTGTDAK